MLLLVFADRDMGGAINQDVGGHQCRIGIEADRSILTVLAGFLLELGHAVEPAEPRHAIEYPSEFGVLGDLALVEYDISFRIDPAGQKGGGDLADRPRQFAGVLPYRNGVQIDDAINAVETVLQLDEALNRAEIIAEMKVAGRLHAGENQLLELHLQRPRPSESNFTVNLVWSRQYRSMVSPCHPSACRARGARYSARPATAA